MGKGAAIVLASDQPHRQTRSCAMGDHRWETQRGGGGNQFHSGDLQSYPRLEQTKQLHSNVDDLAITKRFSHYVSKSFCLSHPRLEQTKQLHSNVDDLVVNETVFTLCIKMCLLKVIPDSNRPSSCTQTLMI